MPPTTRLPDATSIGNASLSVKMLDRSIEFYQHIIGLKVHFKGDEFALLGTDEPFLTLVEKAGASPAPRRSTGLYHLAILLPSRRDLARAIRHIAVKQYPMEGYSDHLVSEAFYLSDPDGHGLELYRDRPREAWPMNGDQLEMANAPIDLEEFFAEADGDPAAYPGAPDGTRIGHMHLKVGDSSRAVDFYTRVVGFSTTQMWHGAGFVSAGGYHHHLGLNQWNSQGGGAPPESSAHLKSWTIRVPSAADIDAAAVRLDAAKVSYTRHDGGLSFADPWGIELSIEA